MSGPFNATRHAQQPLPQPTYSFRDVPHAKKGTLKGSIIQYVTERSQLHDAMAEFLLVCKEAVRRRRVPTDATANHNNNNSKPLSLEYLADRLDIDDPCWGYMVRTQHNDHQLQGFITMTTFTNWQSTFRWDSHHAAAYECDDTLVPQNNSERVRDTTAQLAAALQATVHCGDIHDQGIVWPRIAEISLLGGLGCGKALVELVLEELECRKPTAMANYEYVVLQATDASIPFYESLGFVRVGAIMRDVAEGEEDVGFASNSTGAYTVQASETLKSIAAKLDVELWDLLFLNRHIIGNAKGSDKPFLGTSLLIPRRKQESESLSSDAMVDIQWHTAKENETPRSIANLYNVNHVDVVRANQTRLPTLLSNSRLRSGTRIRVSHLDAAFSEYKAYAHWSFPDKLYDEPEPSYMMARKLNPRKPSERNYRPFQSSLLAPVVPYERPKLLLPPSPSSTVAEVPVDVKPPARPLSAYMMFSREQREQNTTTASTGVMSIRDRWKALSERQQAVYITRAQQAQAQYTRDKQAYDEQLNGATKQPATPKPPKREPYSLYNRVVRLKPTAMNESPEFTYWYVLTFIPDLKWCHLAPMVQDGVFGPRHKAFHGKPRWRLLDESSGKELDISSSFCIPIRSHSMRKCEDADKEEWAIVDDGTIPVTPNPTQRQDYSVSAIKPSSVRKHHRIGLLAESPTLLATIPNSGKLTTVHVMGKSLFQQHPPPSRNIPTIPLSARKAVAMRSASQEPAKRKRGRPKGSKNKPKYPSQSASPPRRGKAWKDLSSSSPRRPRVDQRRRTCSASIDVGSRRGSRTRLASLRTPSTPDAVNRGTKRSAGTTSSRRNGTAVDPPRNRGRPQSVPATLSSPCTRSAKRRKL